MGSQGAARFNAKAIAHRLIHLALLAMFVTSTQLLLIADMIPPVGGDG